MPIPPPRKRLPELPPEPDSRRDYPLGPPGKFIPPPPKSSVGSAILKIAALCLVLIVGLFFLLYEPDLMSTEGVNQDRVIALANMSPLPKSAIDIKVLQPEDLAAIQGSKFKPALLLQFRAPDAEVQQWIADSPGTKDVVPKMQGVRDYIYSIDGPKNESTYHAELRWFRSEGRVLLSVALDEKSIPESGKWQPKGPQLFESPNRPIR